MRLALAALLLSACAQQQEDAPDLTLFVNPLIGTDYTGNTYPGAQVPFGMVQLSPDNGLPGWDRIAGYFYPDSTIAGFSHTHLSGTGAGDLYDISFLPVTEPLRVADPPLGVHSRFSHDEECANAGYYRVRLSDYDITVELTATERCGIQRYTFPDGKQPLVLLNLSKAMNWDFTQDTEIRVIDSVTVAGYRFSDGWARRQRLYFCTRFSHPFTACDISADSILQNGNFLGMAKDARFTFTAVPNNTITVSTALSCTSIENAARNLAAEVPTDDFDSCHAKAKRLWNDALSKIEISLSPTLSADKSANADKSATADKSANGPISDNRPTSPGKPLPSSAKDDARVIFYTALYHAMLAPTIYSDIDGGYYGPDGEVHNDGFTNYGTFSLWDTYRAAHPLYTLIQTARTRDMVRSLVAFAKQNGRLPVWNFQGSETDMMIGYHAAAVIADAYLKGICTEGADEALDICVKTANLDNYRGIGLYKSLGYIPFESADEHNSDNWSLSRTLEYAFDDWCIAEFAQHLGDSVTAGQFYHRAQNFRNVYNPATSFMQPRGKDGSFITPFAPTDYSEHICESNAWHYFWSVQHDIPALISLVGGAERFEQKLDSMFTFDPDANADLPLFSTGMIGQYAHGNEPSHHVAYLYNAIRQPHKAQRYINRIMRNLYLNAPDGLCGNEDCGQTSAWYVFSALGFYPVNPASGIYELGAPLFDKATLHLENGNSFTITAKNLSPDNFLVKEVRLNGKKLTGTTISHADIMRGGTLEFEMCSE